MPEVMPTQTGPRVILQGVSAQVIATTLSDEGIDVKVTSQGDTTILKGGVDELDTAVQVLVDGFGGRLSQLKRAGFGTDG